MWSGSLMEIMNETIAYKVLTEAEMTALLAGTFLGAQVDLADGYIHLSTASQLEETVRRHFAGRSNLFIAAVDVAMLGDAVRWEVSRHGQLFPHLYGALPLEAATAYGKLTLDAAGHIRLPAKHNDF